jgi:dethiobiotin synthetase
VRAVTVWLVTGTDTGVGKTVVTAAIAAAATAGGHRVAVIKPGQTGIQPGSADADPRVESDMDTVARLAAPATVLTVATYPEPMAPLAAAQEAGVAPLALGDAIEAFDGVAGEHDVVLIEGAGGLLVPMGEGGWTVADLALALRCPAVVVARAGLGTLNHTALTFEAMHRRGVSGCLVLGAWPEVPDTVHWRNLADLPGDLAGVLPDGVGGLSPQRFQAAAPDWLTPLLFGRADPEQLRSDGVPGPPPDWPEPIDLKR